MKHGKKPTVAQRKYISAHKLNAENWLVAKDTSTEMVLVHRHFDGKTRVIRKETKCEMS